MNQSIRLCIWYTVALLLTAQIEIASRKFRRNELRETIQKNYSEFETLALNYQMRSGYAC